MTAPHIFGGMGDPELEKELARLAEASRRLEEIQGRLATLRGEGEALNGQVTAQVDQAGRLTGLEIEPKAMRLGSKELARAILAAAAGAAGRVDEQIRELAGPLVGDPAQLDALLEGRLPEMDFSPEATVELLDEMDRRFNG